jgi:hypothetical protein
MMRNPPLDWDDLSQLGVVIGSAIAFDGETYSVQPQPPKFARQLLAALASRPVPDGDRMAYLRHIRDLLMGLTDWTQAADSPLTESQRQAWATYRQALRDLPQAYSGEGPIPWPVAP